MFFVERYIVDWGRLPPFFVWRIGVDFLSGCLCAVGFFLADGGGVCQKQSTGLFLRRGVWGFIVHLGGKTLTFSGQTFRLSTPNPVPPLALFCRLN